MHAFIHSLHCTSWTHAMVAELQKGKLNHKAYGMLSHYPHSNEQRMPSSVIGILHRYAHNCAMVDYEPSFRDCLQRTYCDNTKATTTTSSSSWNSAFDNYNIVQRVAMARASQCAHTYHTAWISPCPTCLNIQKINMSDAENIHFTSSEQ
eukprot:scaffold66598_cov35-Prasinocladus_malaysianus.AAC.1